MPQHKALLIGASEYDDTRIQNLDFVPDDLRRLQDVLVQRGFRSADIVEGGRGITPNVVNGRVRSFLRAADPGDTLLVILSGHGQHFEGKDYLIPEDATFDAGVFAESCIEIGWDRELEESAAAHVVFLVDACREGIDRDTMAPPGVQPWSRRKIAAALRRKVAYVYGCTAPELALFVRESDITRPGFEPGTQPGESFSLFSRAMADTIAADPHALRLREFFERVQLRVDELHRAYGKARTPQRVTLRTDSAVGGEDFPLLPGPDRRPENHPWIQSVDRHPVWQCTPEGAARERLQEACRAIVGRLATTYEAAARAIDDDPWHDAELAQRTHDRLAFLTGRLTAGEQLSPTEAALAVLLPLVEQTFWAQEAAQRKDLLTDPGASGPEHTRFRKFAQGFPRIKRRLLALHQEKTAADSVTRIRWWLFHRWLIQQPGLYAAEALKALIGDVAAGPDQPPWVADALGADRLMRLLKEHRTAPFSTRLTSDPLPRRNSGERHEDHDVIAASTGDEHEVRASLVSALVKAAYAMAVDPVDLPEIVVEHIGIYDSVDLGTLLVTVRRSDWRNSGMGRSLNAVCTHPAIQIALQSHADRVDELLRDINRGGDPTLAPLGTLPPYADGKLVRLTGNAPDQLSDGIRFQLAEDRVQELLMGEQLYGESELAVRELYQNALDAVRYRDCRTQYLRRTGRPVASWTGRIEFAQGVGPDGRPYLECRDNGIGMGLAELKGVFSQGGARFVDLPEYIEEQAAWAELPDPKPTLHPNSRFGIGVLSYFMLADEIVVRTRRMGRDGRPGRLLQVTIAGPGNLFRVEYLAEEEEEKGKRDGEWATGTSVRLLLARRGTDVSCVEALQRVLWVAPYSTSATHGSRRHYWTPGELSEAAVELNYSMQNGGLTLEKNTVAYASVEPDVWWVDEYGVVLSDGLLAEVDSDTDGVTPFGAIVNLHGDRAPELSVDRTKILAFDSDHVAARMADAARGLTDPELALPNAEWLDRAANSSVSFADCVAEHAERADLLWQLKQVSLPYSRIGFFPPDAALLPLVTGEDPEFDLDRASSFLYNLPVPVLRWRLRTLYRAGLGGPVSVPGTEPSDDLCARPSDLEILRAPFQGGRHGSWNSLFDQWLTGPEIGERYWAVPSRALVKTGCVSLGMLFPWQDPGTPLSSGNVFDLSQLSDRAPAEIAERLTALGYRVEPLLGCAVAQPDDLPLLRPLGTRYGWLPPNADLSAAQVCLSAARASCSTSQAAGRLTELGFTVPATYPVRDTWTDDELDIVISLWQAHSTLPDPEGAQHVSRAQLTSAAQRAGGTVQSVARLLGELGFALPTDGAALPELDDDDRALLGYEGEWPPVDTEVSYPYLIAVTRRVKRPVGDVAARLRELGYTTAEVSGMVPPSREELALRTEAGLHEHGPLHLRTVVELARRTETSIATALSRFASVGYECTVSADLAGQFTGHDPDALLSNAADPNRFGPVSPQELHAVTLHSAQNDETEVVASLTGLGFEVTPRSPEWEAERALEQHLLRELARQSLMPEVEPGDPPTVSLVTLAVVALRTGRTLREVALLASETGMRHEIEDWFSPDPQEPPAPSASAAPPPSATAPPPGS